MTTYQFISEDALEVSSPVSEEDEHEGFPLLSQTMYPTTDLQTLTPIASCISDLNLERER